MAPRECDGGDFLVQGSLIENFRWKPVTSHEVAYVDLF